MFDSNAFIGEDVIVQPSRYEEGENHSLHKIFSLLAQGQTSKKIRKAHPDILPETITVARAILVARNPEYFPDTKSDKMFQDFKVLIDENISPSVAGYLRQHFKKVSHVHDVGLTGKRDELVWQWALNNSCDVIFTKDKANETDQDLTYVAIHDAQTIIRAVDEKQNKNISLSALPLLVHLPNVRDVEAELKKLLRRNKDEFFNFLDNRATPYLDVRSGKIECGPTYFELRGENHIQDKKLSPMELGQVKLEEKTRIKNMWLSRLGVDEIRNMTPERERKIDDVIKAAVGMGGGRDIQRAYLP